MIQPKITLNLCGSLLVLENPVVMAVININADSFYEKSFFRQLQRKLAKESEVMFYFSINHFINKSEKKLNSN